MSGILGVKVGMSELYSADGKRVPVTLVSTLGCVVVQTKSKEKDGYTAVQLGIGDKSPRKVSKALKKHFEKAKTKPTRWLREFRVEDLEKFQVGQAPAVDFVKPGDIVKVSGSTKGRGFSGVMKKWGFKGGPGGHGSRFHRRPGSIGNNTNPRKVFKKRPMPGHYGDETRTVQNEVVDVLKDEHLIVLKGAVPGGSKSLLEIRKM